VPFTILGGNCAEERENPTWWAGEGLEKDENLDLIRGTFASLRLVWEGGNVPEKKKYIAREKPGERVF